MFFRKKTLTDLVVIFIIGSFIGFLAPFGMDSVPKYISIGFWIVVCLVGYLIYKPCISELDRRFKSLVHSRLLRTAIAVVVATLPATIVLVLVNHLFWGFEINLLPQIVSLYPKVLIIGGVISAISILKNYAEEQSHQLQKSLLEKERIEAKLKTDPYARLNEQLPIAKRGKVISIETADHYINITTEQGKHLLLMRFKDVLAMLADAPGLQVHRSWWVAKDAIQEVKKDGRKTFLYLNDGTEVPVSRSFQESLKQSGIK